MSVNPSCVTVSSVSGNNVTGIKAWRQDVRMITAPARPFEDVNAQA